MTNDQCMTKPQCARLDWRIRRGWRALPGHWTLDISHYESHRLPQVVRLLGVGRERQFHFAASPRGFVRGEDNFKDRAPILPADQGRAVILHAIDEVRHLLGKTVVPFL